MLFLTLMPAIGAVVAKTAHLAGRVLHRRDTIPNQHTVNENQGCCLITCGFAIAVAMMGAVVEHIKEITVALEAVLEVSFTQLSYDEIHAGTQLRLSDVAFIALLILVPVFVFLVFITTDGDHTARQDDGEQGYGGNARYVKH